jgi:hypothetical protein
LEIDMSKAPRLRTMYMPDADRWDCAKGYDWEPLPLCRATAPAHKISMTGMAERPHERREGQISKSSEVNGMAQTPTIPLEAELG